MIENLTSHARQVLEFAHEEAEARSSARVEPIHLLLALLGAPRGGVVRIFRELVVLPVSLLRQVEAIAPRASLPSGLEWLEGAELGPGVLRVLELAADEACQGGHDLVDTDHLLIGIFRLEKDPTNGVLARAGLTPDSMRPVVRSRGTLREDILDVRKVIERSTSKVTLRDLEKKGFRKVKVLRAGDINQLIEKAVLTVLAKQPSGMGEQERQQVLADAKTEYERQTKRLQELQEAEDRSEAQWAKFEATAAQIQAAHESLMKRLPNVDAELKAERDKIAAARTALDEARRQLERDKQALSASARHGTLTCPLGHAAMDRVVRGDVKLAVCPECLSTFFAPGQLEALMKELPDLSIEALRRFLEPENDGAT